ncbi:AI-2E family transporter [Undibacterium arcticum]|uniref:AI-2E family transporter n=1 Tax=Undibacterium arcticum TaxID=1762892 RepID=UPI003610C2A5
MSFTFEQKQSALWLVLGLALLVLLVLLGPVMTPFIAAAILAYALNPGVDLIASLRLGKFRVPRSLAVVLMMLLLLAAILALVLIVLPVLQTEIPMLRDQIPTFLTRLNNTLAPPLAELGIHVRLDGAGIKTLLTQQLSTSGDEIWRAMLASAKVGGIAVLGWLATLLLIPMVLFYLLLDWHPFLKKLEHMVPRRWAARTVAMAQEVDGLLAQYLRGQLLVMLILAAYYSVALTIAGFDVALPVGIVTGLLVFIPYLGFGIGLVLALIAAALQFTGLHGLVAVAIIYSIGQVLEGFFLTPRLVGERIGLHPLVVIFALLAFGQLFGFVGVLLALPASAILSVAFKHLRLHYLNSSFYNAQTNSPNNPNSHV